MYYISLGVLALLLCSFGLQTINATFLDIEAVNVVVQDSQEYSQLAIPTSLQVVKKSQGLASVSLPSNTKLVYENGKDYDVSLLKAPALMTKELVSSIEKNLPEDIRSKVVDVYSIGGNQKLFVKNASTQKSAYAFVTLPVTKKTFGSKIDIYTSNDGVNWSFHDTSTVSVVNEDVTVSFTTNHFTYFLLVDVVGTFVINADAVYTTGLSVTLQNDIPGATLMKFSNTYTGLQSAPWSAYAATTGWVLSTGNGTKTVYALFQNSGGGTGYVSDTILLQENYTLPVLSSPGTVTTPSETTTKTFDFTSNAVGSVFLTGACAGLSQTPTTVSGANIITFGSLAVGTYNDCGVYIVDALGAISNTLDMNSFTVTAPVSGTPGTIPGLKLWLDASDASTISLSTNRVTQWRDKSGNLNHVTPPGATNRPLLLSANLNGMNTIQFATNDTLRTVTGSLLGANSNYFKFMVVKADSSVGYNSVLYGGGHVMEFSPNTTRPALYHSSTFLASATSAGTSNYVIVTATYNPSQANTIYMNGTLEASNTSTFNFTDAGPAYVGSYSNADYLDGRLAEVGMYNQVPTSEERQALECYLSEKRGIALSYSCSTPPPVLSNPSAISSPVTGSSVAFSFTSTSTGTITLYGNCGGLLLTPTSGQAVSGVNNISIGTLSNNISYNNCSVSVTNPSSGISNILAIPSFSVQNNLAPYISSGSPTQTTMMSYDASMSFVVSQPGPISLSGSCATSAISPSVAVSGSNIVQFAYLPVGVYSNCSVMVTNSSGARSNVFVMTGFTIIEQPSLSIKAPVSLSLTGIQATSTVNNVNYSLGTMFSVDDKSGINTGRYTTIQSTSLSGTYTSIPASAVSLSATGIAVITGASNSSVLINTGLATYQSIDTPLTYIYRSSGGNYGRKGEYGNLPLLRVSVPAYPRVDSYQGTLLFTLYNL